ncbi:MAG: glycoside hydrolase family 25 protein [Saprospiraceae bacterium]|nr:glycoside hydrolase family 25 protein [Saprospiraceae bacterium]
MIKVCAIFFLLCTALVGLAQVSEFNQPWMDSTKALILDPYHGNDLNWEELASDKRVAGIIHKATQGNRVDKKYRERKETAKARGYKWGSYHLGVPGSPVAQADFYLETVGIHSDEIYALDLENLNPRSSMPLDSAVKFITRMHEKTGRYPLIYCNRVVLDGISEKFDSSSVFAKCPLWHARFRNDIPDFNTATWTTYTLWQFSCEINCHNTGPCPYRVPGTNADMDINVYNGTIEELLDKWPDI